LWTNILKYDSAPHVAILNNWWEHHRIIE